MHVGSGEKKAAFTQKNPGEIESETGRREGLSGYDPGDKGPFFSGGAFRERGAKGTLIRELGS